MIFYKRIYTLLLCTFVLSGYARINERNNMTHFSVQDGLSQISVLCIEQDARGYLWFGTRNGLNRFNGYDFEVFVNDPAEIASLSNNHVLCLEEDTSGNLWIGTRGGLNRYDPVSGHIMRYYDPRVDENVGHDFIYSLLWSERDSVLWVGANHGLYYYDPREGSLLEVNADGVFRDNEVSALAVRSGSDMLYVGTRRMGLVEWNVHTGQYVIYRNLEDEKSTVAKDIRCLFYDSHGYLWVGTFDAGIYVLNEAGEVVVHYGEELNSQCIRDIEEAPDGRIWVATSNGIQVIDRDTKHIDFFSTDSHIGLNLAHHSVHALFFDWGGTLWVGSYAGGVNCYNPHVNRFENYAPLIDMNVSASAYGQAVEYGHCLYIGTQGNGLLEFDRKSGISRLYKLVPNGTFDRNIIKYLYLSDGYIYCSSSFGDIYRFSLTSKKFEKVFADRTAVLLDDVIYQLEVKEDGNLLFGSVGKYGLSRIRPNGDIQRRFPIQGGEKFLFSNVTCFLEIERDVYLIGTRYDGLYRYDFQNHLLRHYGGEELSDRWCLGGVQINQIFRDSADRIWLATAGAGLYQFDLQKEVFHPYVKRDGLLNNNVCAIVETEDHHLWLSTASGISEFDPQKGVFRNFSYEDGIEVNEFAEQAGLRTSDGTIYFFGDNGFVSFKPEYFTKNNYVPPIVIENIYLDNQKLIPGPNGVLTANIPWQNEIVLDWHQSNLAIEYAALSYVASNKNTYSYKLEGFEDHWNDVGNRRMAYYTNIPPGEYLFRVVGSNNDGVVNTEGASLKITILSPLWQRWWAWTLYVLLAGVIVWQIVRYYFKQQQLKEDIRLEQLKAKTQQEFHKERNKLFTNFSHELRSPLTLIMSPLDDMALDPDISEKWRDRIKLMQNNSQRLLRLVNNLMYFTKNESGNLQLKVQEEDWIEFSQEMHLLFSELAFSRNIVSRFEHRQEALIGWFDPDLMEKVYFNFLSNAFKNTPNGGCVILTLSEMTRIGLEKRFGNDILSDMRSIDSYVVLEIADSGPGIPPGEYLRIFDPFYQVAQNEHARSGTGLGLSLSKMIVEMHRGVVWAGKADSGGALFTCVFPLGRTFFRDDEFAKESGEQRILSDCSVEIPCEESGNAVELVRNNHKYTVLVVEDNADLRMFLKSCLSSYYNVMEASNARDGMERSIHYLPDIILSDLMMPGMDGLEMSRKLKNDIRTSHIPIIMITARSTATDIEVGYRCGVDDYITKPFNTRVLLARVGNILSSREHLKERYGKQFSLESLGVEATSLDERFMQRVYKVLSGNLAKVDLELDDFCKELGMSRSNLYRKIKAITGLSPNEFVRNFRLETAARMLKESNLSVSEIYVAVGFNTHAYFSSCFKKHFGVSPTEFVKKN